MLLLSQFYSKTLLVCILVLLSQLFFCSVHSKDGFEFDDKVIHWLQTLSRDFRNTIRNQIERGSGADHLKKLYELNNDWSVVSLNPAITLSETITKLENILQSAENAVKELAAKSTELNRKSYENPDELTSKEVRFYKVDQHINDSIIYYNAKCVCGHQLPDGRHRNDCYTPEDGFHHQKEFAANVSFSLSAVHIPVDVYNESPNVLRDIDWTQALDSTFKSLFCNRSHSPSPRFKWSYVATLSGAVRYFPARPWSVPCGKVDLFDGRRMHWFVQSMTSPKHVVIMIDTSGSIIGLTLSLVRVSVEHVLQSLTTNDFFNVIVFNLEANFLNPNCPGLLPANPRNKEMVKWWLKNLKVQNPSSFENAFDFAFEVLKNNSWSAATNTSCNPVILLFTDGGAEYPYTAFQKWNDNHRTRVFTYSVGKHFSSTSSLERMACNNKGTFASIPSDSATHFESMKYLVKLSKPLALSDHLFSEWTLPYQDHLGLGTVLTVSRPIVENYAISGSGKDEHSHQVRVAGIAAVDVLYSDIQRALDASQLGAAAYFFAIDNNGYLLFHPLLEKGRLDEPVMVDLEHVELSNITEVRRDMIDRKNKVNVKLVKGVLSQDEEHLTSTPFNYSYSGRLSQTMMSIGLALPSSDLHRLHALPSSVDLDLIVIPDPNVFSAAYGLIYMQSFNTTSICSDDDGEVNGDVDDDVTPDLLLLRDVTQIADAFTKLVTDNADQSRELFLHGRVTSSLVRSWNETSMEESVIAKFVATDSSPAILRILHNSDTNLKESVENVLSDPHTKDYFLRPILTQQSKQVFFSLTDLYATPERVEPPATSQTPDGYQSTRVFDMATNTYQQSTSPTTSYMKEQNKYFIVSQVVPVVRSAIEVRPAVVGMILNYESVKESLFNRSRCGAGPTTGCGDLPYDCWDEDRFYCVLLDDAGFILIGNSREGNVGKFLGDVNGNLMKRLHGDDVYTSNNVRDYQAVCKSEDSDGNSAVSAFIAPSIGDIIQSGLWFTSSLFFAAQTFFSLLLTSLRAVTSQSLPEFAYSQSETLYPNSNVIKAPCVVERTVFSFGPNTTSFERSSYVASRISGTNLLFVIANVNQSASSKPYPIQRKSVLKSSVECVAKRYRRDSPEPCFDASCQDCQELMGNDDCGASQLATPIPLLSILLLIRFLPVLWS